jgi:hypothetical protein
MRAPRPLPRDMWKAMIYPALSESVALTLYGPIIMSMVPSTPFPIPRNIVFMILNQSES